jgi:hypothetical protein
VSQRLGTICGELAAAASSGTASNGTASKHTASNDTARRRPVDRTAIRALLAAIVMALALMLTSPPAFADECALTDPNCLTDQIEDTVEAVEEAVGSGGDTVGEAAEDAAETVEGTLNDTTGTVRDIIDGLLGDGGNEDPGENKGKDAGRAGGGSARAGNPDGFGSGRLAPRDPSFEPGTFGAGAGQRGRTQAIESGGGLGRAITDGVRDLAFPVLLVAVVLGFLAVQNRLDRRDPRLATAPVGPEFLTFD